MKPSILISILFLTTLSSCLLNPKIERHPFPPMPNIDSLNSANRIIGKHYFLIDSFPNADFNYSNIDRIDSFSTIAIDSVRSVFNPIIGQFTVFQFIAEFNGLAYGNVIETFHDVLIIKINQDRKIIDAFQYTLEWGEMPVSYDLYELSKDSITLEDKMELNRLEMVAKRELYNDVDRLLDSGLVHLNRR
jgi:hypothetical protein